jgi:flagellar hook-basal body complex protein FliE
MIPAIPPIATPAVPGVARLALDAAAVDGPATGANPDFAAQLGRGLQNVQAAQHEADNLAVQAATGSLTDVHDYLVASTQAALATQLTVALRNKAVEAFNEIMRMQG